MDRRMDRRTVAKGAGAVASAAALGLFPASGRGKWSAADDSRRNRVCTTGWAATSGSPWSSTASATRSSVNPILNKNPALKAWNETQAEARLPGLKFGRTLWIAAAAGGPFVYTGLPLSEAHAEFNLTAEQFAEVGAEIVRALDFYEVPEREQQELVAAYSASMSDVVTATE